MKKYGFLLFAIFACACSKSNNTAGANIIKVGEVSSLTGSEAAFGTSTHNGIKLYFDEVNAAGGINGKKLELITYDDQSKPEEAATGITKLITQDKVITVLGEVASSRSMAMAPIAQQYKIPMITPSSTNPKVTQLGDYIFRTCFIDPYQGKVMAKFALNDLNYKRIAVLRDIKSDYSVGLADYFSQAFKQSGGIVLVDQSYSGGDIDFKSQLTSIRETNPEAIFVPGYYTEVGLIARQARELGINVPLLGGDGWNSTKLIEIGGSAIQGSYFSDHYSPEDSTPIVQDFIKKYKTAYNETPDGMAATGYDAAQVLVDAIKRADSTDSTTLRNAIANTKDFTAVTGNITINASRDATKSAVVLQVADTHFTFKTKVNP